MKENKVQVEKMMKLSGEKGVWFVTNYQYQSTVFGI